MSAPPITLEVTRTVTETITIEPIPAVRVHNKIAQLAGERPDRKSQARLVLDRKPECPVGVALVELGVLIEALIKVGGSGRPLIANRDTDDFRWIMRFQHNTDTGRTWGEARISADAYIEGLHDGRHLARDNVAITHPPVTPIDISTPTNERQSQ